MRWIFLILALPLFSMANAQQERPVNNRPVQKDAQIIKRITIEKQYDSLIKIVRQQVTTLNVEIILRLKKIESLKAQIKQAELDLGKWTENALKTLTAEEFKSQLFWKKFETEKKIRAMEEEIELTDDHIEKNKMQIKELENKIKDLEKEKVQLLKML